MDSKFYSDRYTYTEAQKDSEEYLVTMIDNAIAELVQEKEHLIVAYNYYNGIRDAEQFRYLEENYGIGNPTAVEFIPLVRRHVDALIGEHLQNRIKPKITCKDKKTLGKITKLRTEEINRVEMNKLQSQFYSNLQYSQTPDEDKETVQVPTDEADDMSLGKAKDEVAKNFLSEYEIAAQHVLTHLQQSKYVDLTNKRKILFTDLLVAGQCFYKVTTRRKGETPRIEVLNPFDVFFDRNYNSLYIKESPRVIVRKWHTREQIMNIYGHWLTKDDIESLGEYTTSRNNGAARYVRAPGKTGLIANVGVALDSDYNFYDQQQYQAHLIPVYEVEWLATNKVKEGDETVYRMDRYKGVRIGGDIYVDMGRDDEVVRSQENPYECATSVNGMFYSDRNGKPYSLVLQTTKLQDKYDLLHFQRDNLISSSGVKGNWVDMSNLPTFLGATPQERLLKFKAYEKQGLALMNTAQEGRGANHNTTFAGYDNTVPGQAIQAIQFAIQATEDTCSGITGVWRERLGGIEQRDAVSNVEVGIQTSATITKQYYQVMDSVTTELLTDAINACKVSYKEGYSGSLVLGDKLQKIFTITPKYFSFTDYDIHISDSSDIIRDMQDIKQLTMELVKSGLAEVDTIVEAMGTESLTELRDVVTKSVNKKKEEMNVTQQLQQQLQQVQEQFKQLQQQAQKVQSENEQLKAKSTEIDAKKVEYDYDVKKEANKNSKDFNDSKLELDKSRVELEKLQLFDSNKDNDEIKNQ